MQKVTLVAASPRTSVSTSGRILSVLGNILQKDGMAVAAVYINKNTIGEETRKALREGDIWVVGFPLYVDGIPSHLLSCLRELEKSEDKGHKTVYAIVNCGFYEGEQCKNAIHIFENWAARCQFVFGGGLGIGGGPALEAMAPEKWVKGPMSPVYLGLETLAASIRAGQPSEVHYVSVGMPRQLYKLAGQMGFRNAARQAGLRRKDMDARPRE